MTIYIMVTSVWGDSAGLYLKKLLAKKSHKDSSWNRNYMDNLVCSTAVYMYIYVAVNTGAMQFSHHHHHPQSCYVCPMGVIGHPLLSSTSVRLELLMWPCTIQVCFHQVFLDSSTPHNFRSTMFLFAVRFPIHYGVQCSSHNTLTTL